jgi:hypothetical protein
LSPQARIFAGSPVQSGALVLQFILELVDLILLHPQFAFEQLLAQVTAAA